MSNTLSNKEQFIVFIYSVYINDPQNVWIDFSTPDQDIDTKIVKALKAYREDPQFHNTVNVAINLILQGEG